MSMDTIITNVSTQEDDMFGGYDVADELNSLFGDGSEAPDYYGKVKTVDDDFIKNAIIEIKKIDGLFINEVGEYEPSNKIQQAEVTSSRDTFYKLSSKLYDRWICDGFEFEDANNYMVTLILAIMQICNYLSKGNPVTLEFWN